MKLWLAGGFLLGGCGIFGGQTGQDGSAAPGGPPPCHPVEAPANQQVDGTSPSELAKAYEGQHTEALRWRSSKPGDAGTRTSGDEVTIVVTYKGADGTVCDDLEVPVTVDVRTRDSGVHESGDATLRSTLGSPDEAWLHFNGKTVTASVILRHGSGGVDMKGTLQADMNGLPEPVADFPPPNVDAGILGSPPPL